MSTVGAEDGSEDVADFLERIKELGDKRAKEDEERTRKLEDEILQGRKERQARRAERARSISPTKDSPLFSATKNTPLTTDTRSQTPPMSRGNENERPDLGPPLPNFEPSKPSPPNTSLSRSGTLSWQQRPSSRGSPVRSRPLSQFASENAARSPRPTPEPEVEEKELTLGDRAKALESKDPSWFRQTADRGVGSAAYRKNQDSPEPVPTNIRLPGLSRESSLDPDMTSPDRGASRPTSTHGSTVGTPTAHHESSSISSQVGARSPFPTMSTQKFEAQSGSSASVDEEKRASRSIAMSPRQNRITDQPERSVSPTKGLGGFVQSAMLKRSDSVTKRLSQQTPSLSRGNSTASNRGAASPVGKFSSLRSDTVGEVERQELRDLEPSLVDSKAPDSPTKDGEFARPGLPSRTSQRSDSVTDGSRTLDPKRYSQAKSSWLENAINRPPSPVKMKPAVSKQPEWMQNLAKAKQARGSVDLGKPSSHEKVEGGGLLRSPPMGITSPSTFRSSHRSSVSSVSRDPPQLDLGRPTSIAGSSKPSENPVNDQAEQSEVKNVEAVDTPTEAVTPKSPEVSKESRPSVKPKPEAAKTDFRSTLKSHHTSNDSKGSDVPEFKKAFGNLKKAETKNYVAPDEFKENITRGKNSLSLTGGPKKTERVDEFKESILKKRSEFEGGKSALITGNFLNKSTDKDKPVPEALAKRQLMSKPTGEGSSSHGHKSSLSGSTSGSLRGKVSEQDQGAIPEALAKRQMMTSKGTGSIRGKSQDLSSELSATPVSVVPQQSPGQQSPEKMAPTSARSPLKHDENALAPGLRVDSGVSSTVGRSSPNTNLANRFNPGLAAMIGRGPSPIKAKQSEDTVDTSNGGDQSTEPETVHTTKGRARGPKRRTAKSPPAVSATSSSPVKDKTTSPERSSTAKSLPSISSVTSASTKPASEHESPERSSTISAIGGHQSATKVPKTPPATKPKRISSLNRESAQPQVPETSTPVTEKQAKAVSPPVPKKPTSIEQVSKEPKSQTTLYLQNFFKDTVGSIKGRVEINTEGVISKREEVFDKLRTKKREIWKVTGDGKKISIPDEYNNMLFDEEMYLLTHVYHTPDWKQKTDVYLWAGDNVAPSELQDALVFCRSAARAIGGTMSIVHQGKEPFNLFEALGGIVIIRFGNSSRLTSSWDNFLLCGRNHMGQIAFDEVPFEKSCLCGGYPYLVCRNGHLTLWKGQGSTTPELSSALLTGNILGSMNGPAEIKEVVEGKETDEFWKLFSDANERKTTDVDWSKKKSAKHFRTRLFQIDARPKSAGFMSWGRRGSSPNKEESPMEVLVTEVHPYAQQDIERDQILVVDTFFKIIVLVPSGCSSKLASFRASLFFAQEYSMLAASLETRDFIPPGFVEFGSTSEDIQYAFRKWDPARVPLKENKVTIDLKDALQAM